MQIAGCGSPGIFILEAHEPGIAPFENSDRSHSRTLADHLLTDPRGPFGWLSI